MASYRPQSPWPPSRRWSKPHGWRERRRGGTRVTDIASSFRFRLLACVFVCVVLRICRDLFVCKTPWIFE